MDDGVKSLVFKDIHSLRQSEASSVIEQIGRIEKRTFPSSEAFDFNISLWRKKPNTRVIYGLCSTWTNNNSSVIAYAVYTRTKGTALLHKVCVNEPYRRRGVGKLLMRHIEEGLRGKSCQSIHLWVDKGREAARRLYLGYGFEEREFVDDYYGPGRTGIKMIQNLDRHET